FEPAEGERHGYRDPARIGHALKVEQAERSGDDITDDHGDEQRQRPDEAPRIDADDDDEHDHQYRQAERERRAEARRVEAGGNIDADLHEAGADQQDGG